VPVPGLPLGLTGVARWQHRRAPLLGEHTAEVLAHLPELTSAEVAELEASEVSGPSWQATSLTLSGILVAAA
jgi:crotonobetainyl-CoA:carnitine CoA-transferase CaiB-like acyl-CoA transferase